MIVSFPPEFILNVILLPKLKLGIIISVLTTIIIGQFVVPEVGGNKEELQFPVLTQQEDDVKGLPELGVHAWEVYVTCARALSVEANSKSAKKNK